MKNFRNIQVDEANLLTWQGLIVPDNPPYDKGAFRIKINFPAKYPFKPPKITFKTKILFGIISASGNYYFFFKYFIYLFEREREREAGRDTGRGRSRLHAGSPMQDSIPGLQDQALG